MDIRKLAAEGRTEDIERQLMDLAAASEKLTSLCQSIAETYGKAT